MAGHDISAGGLVTTLLEMCFANTTGGLHINLHDLCTDGDVVKALFAENPGVVIEVSDEHKFEFRDFMEDMGWVCQDWLPDAEGAQADSCLRRL